MLPFYCRGPLKSYPRCSVRLLHSRLCRWLVGRHAPRLAVAALRLRTVVGLSVGSVDHKGTGLAHASGVLRSVSADFGKTGLVNSPAAGTA